jgi:hypothetical protein
MANLVNIIGVELAAVGENWLASTGSVTFTPEDLSAAVEAQRDPAIRPPILKFGHVDPRGMEVDMDGEPAVGTVQNLRLSANGMTLLGDYMGVPQWLAACMASAYPRRSIEASFNWKTNTGHTHKLALSAVALLGTKYPAITTLADIEAIFNAETIDDVNMIDAEELIAASGRDGSVVTLTKAEPMQEVKAAVLLEQVRRKYYDSLEGNDRWDKWVRQTQLEPNALIVSDDATGAVYSVEFTVNASGEVEFKEPVEVTETYVPVTIAASAGPREIVKFPTKQNPYRDTFAASGQTEDSNVTPEQKKLLGLPEDATDEQVSERLTQLAAVEAQANKESETPSDPNEGGEEDPGKPGTPNPAPGEEQPVAPAEKATAASTQIPEGTVLVDAAAFEEMKQRISQVDGLVEERRVNERDTKIAAAIAEGRIPPARAGHFRKLYDADAESALSVLATLEPGTIPVEKERGYNSDIAASAEDPGYDVNLLTPAERERIAAAKGL